jgi:hypothetical protein
MNEKEATAGVPLSDEEVDSVSGAGTFKTVYKIKLSCVNCSESRTFYTEDLEDYQNEFLRNYSCTNPDCRKIIRGNSVNIMITPDHEVYYKN